MRTAQSIKDKVIIALDTPKLEEAISLVKSLSSEVQAFKIGHALTLNNGLSVIEKLRTAGAQKIFLDLKFHDIPNSVALAVKQAAEYGVWLLTVHTSGGSAMMQAAAEAVSNRANRPLIVGVTVLTSLSDESLRNELGVQNFIETQALHLSKLAHEARLDGVVASPFEAASLRKQFSADWMIVTPGIRVAGESLHDQSRTLSAQQAIENGASFIVVGRTVTSAKDPALALEKLGE